MAAESRFVDGFVHLEGYLDAARQRDLLDDIRDIVSRAPLYVPRMPKSGRPFSVRMTNCGVLGWVSSKEGGYRYEPRHPETADRWPAIPDRLLEIWNDVAAFPAAPEACLVNWYEPSAKLGLHVDADEKDMTAPVVSISLGDDAWFRVGGQKRRQPSERVLLKSGDVVVLGGAARLAYHGIDRIVAGTGTLIGEPGRFNLTLRRVSILRADAPQG
jgi:DNA oxidative demethylase